MFCFAVSSYAGSARNSGTAPVNSSWVGSWGKSDAYMMRVEPMASMAYFNPFSPSSAETQKLSVSRMYSLGRRLRRARNARARTARRLAFGGPANYIFPAL